MTGPDTPAPRPAPAGPSPAGPDAPRPTPRPRHPHAGRPATTTPEQAGWLALGHTAVFLGILPVTGQMALEASVTTGQSTAGVATTQLWAGALLGATIAVLALGQILAINTLFTGRVVGARLGLRPVRLTLASLTGAIPAALLAWLPAEVDVAPRPLLLAALAGLAVAALVLCGAPHGVQPGWWHRVRHSTRR